jgi:lipoprotein-anchoring transpeptidase ErfK/SrfK
VNKRKNQDIIRMKRFSGLFVTLFLLVAAALLSAAFFAFGKERPSGEVTVEAQTGELEHLAEPVTVRFSRPVERQSYEGRVSVRPNTPFRAEWNANGTEMRLVPDVRWQAGVKYQVALGEGRASAAGVMGRLLAEGGALGGSVSPKTFRFGTPPYPKVVSVTPADGAQDVVLGVEDPLTVRFDRSVKDFFIDFRFDPEMSVIYRNNEDKTEFQLLPKEPLKPGATYALNVFSKWRGEGDETYRPLVSSKFSVLPEKPESWSKDLAVRVEEAKKYTRPQKTEGKYIDVNLETQTMVLFEGGRAVDAYPVSSGKRGMETPKGEFAIQNKAKRPLSKRYGLYMPNWMALASDGSFGIHELPEWPNGYKEGATHLGRPVSHGCVRLGVGPAERVWNWADVGTPVVVR